MEEKKQNHFLRNSAPDFLESEIFSELLVYELLGVPVYKYPNLEYTLCPNKRIGNILKSIERTKIGSMSHAQKFQIYQEKFL